MILLDGSFGEGGGQILRTAVAFSAIKGVPIKVEHIRANRPNPGLQAQHITCVKALGELCNASTEGLKLGSKEISFTPGELKGSNFSFDIGTAGSVTLVLQALLPAVLHSKKDFEITLKGGTDVSWSPTVDYMRFVFIPLLKKLGFNLDLTLMKRGYYPAGGGLIKVSARSSNPNKISLIERGVVKEVSGLSHAHKSLEDRNVSVRQNKGARMNLFNRLSNKGVDCKIKLIEEYCDTLSVGSGITLWAECENTFLGGSSLGSKTKRAEKVGLEASKELLNALLSNAPVDVHMADQLIPYLAISGGEFVFPELSNHAKTNIHVVNQFGFNLKVEGSRIKN